MQMKLKDGKSKVLTFSYDDGVVQDIRLIDIFKANGLKGTFNINTGRYCPEDVVREQFKGRLKLSEARKLYKDSGQEIAVHTLTHPDLKLLSYNEVMTEIYEDKSNVERQFGTIARGMAYPYGNYSDEIIECLKKCHICYARTGTGTNNFDFPTDWFAIKYTCHHNSPNLMNLANHFVNDNPSNAEGNWLFYVFGHSYEFDVHNNWNIIEEFASYVSNKEDIWYATNIEIYDYVNAYNSLIYSADGKIIYNPTAYTVWFDIDGKVYSIKPSETKKLKEI